MKRQKGEHWLAKVVEILEAETGDLRELAQIAGENPATFYLGTDLRGCDLRGQDLRGMAFSHLDLSSVWVDEQTLLDAEYKAESEQAERLLIRILVEGESSPHWISDFLDRFDVQVYLAGERIEFYSAIEQHPGPAFIVTSAHRPIEPDQNYVQILAASKGQLAAVKALGVHNGRTIIVPLQGPSAAYPLSDSRLRRAIDIAVSNWGLLNSPAYKRRPLILVENRRKAASFADSWAHLYEQAQEIGFSPRVGFTIGTQERGPFEEVLFHNLIHIQAPRPRRASHLNVAALFEPEKQVDPANLPLIAIRQCLGQNGWEIEDRPGADFQIQGPKGAFDVWFGKSHYVGEAEPDLKAIRNLQVRLTLSPYETAARLNSRVLILSAADLVSFSAEEGTIWSLLGIQARRMARSNDINARSRFFSVLIRYTISRYDYAEAEALLAPMLRNAFSDRSVRLSATLLSSPDEDDRYQIVFEEAALARNNRLLSIGLTINDEGLTLQPSAERSLF